MPLCFDTNLGDAKTVTFQGIANGELRLQRSY